ncbi:MAG: hypothetical protein KJ077_47930, partial [Anaerolineae bacterium]|nr:hypothetical protein [Anaerolineae bacterium]
MTSRKTFYIGATTAGALISGLALRQFLRERTAPSGAPAQSISRLISQSESSKIQTLPGLRKITPASLEQLGGQHCGTCGLNPDSKVGPWYIIRRQAYCHDCAREEAQKEGMELVSPAPSVPSTMGTSVSHWANPMGRRVRLQPGWVNTGVVKNVDGYIVLDGHSGKPTGLVIAPGVKIDSTSQPSVNTTRWYVNYDRINKALAGPYESVNQAKAIASILANFDWNRPMEEFSKEE